MSAQPTIEQFTEEAHAFLSAHAEQRPPASEFVWGQGSDDVAVFDEKDREAELAEANEAKRWRGLRFDHGFGWISGPEQYGGRGLSGKYEKAYATAEAQYLTPPMGLFTISLGMVAPTILAHGTDLAKDAYLRDLYRGDMVACQLFSEPGAGSDLASLQTKAVRDGDEWVVTGQKVWTSGAQFSDIGEIICRTDPSLPKHKGLTGFLVDMKSPGVEIRPLRQMTGGASFNEVFFNEVRVPDWYRLGEVNSGWGVALTTLMNERAAIGAGGGGGEVSMMTRITAMVRHYGLQNDALVRDMVANMYINYRVANFNNKRAMDKMKAGQTPGPEMSISKMALVNNQKLLNDFLCHVLGAKLQADTGEWGTYAWHQLILGAPGMRIAGGSDEVMRNIVGERVLGLPKDLGIDSKSPFRDLAK